MSEGSGTRRRITNSSAAASDNDNNDKETGDNQPRQRTGDGESNSSNKGTVTESKGLHKKVTPLEENTTQQTTTKHLYHPTELKDDAPATYRPVSIGAGPSGLINMIDTYDRPGSASAVSSFARSGTYVNGLEDKPGKRIPKVGSYAEAGYGDAYAEWSVCQARARGPHAGAYVQASASSGVGAMATASVASAEGKAGPVSGKVGLSFDTGFNIGPDGVEAKLFGFGGSIGPTTSFDFFGSGLSFSFW